MMYLELVVHSFHINIPYKFFLSIDFSCGSETNEINSRMM